MTDATVAQACKMFNGKPHSRFVVGNDCRQPAAAVGAVDQNDRYRRCDAVIDNRISQGDGRKYETVNAAGDQLVDEFLLSRAVGSDVDDDRCITLGAERFRHSAQNGRESGIGNIRSEHPDQARSPRPQARGRHIHLIAKCRRSRADSFGHVCRDEMVHRRAERARHGRGMHAASGGHILDRRA